jgi:hypothetical protein
MSSAENTWLEVLAERWWVPVVRGSPAATGAAALHWKHHRRHRRGLRRHTSLGIAARRRPRGREISLAVHIMTNAALTGATFDIDGGRSAMRVGLDPTPTDLRSSGRTLRPLGRKSAGSIQTHTRPAFCSCATVFLSRPR